MTTVALALAILALGVSLVTAFALVELNALVTDGESASSDPQIDLRGFKNRAPSAAGLPEELDQDSTVVLFTSPTCSHCKSLVDEMKRADLLDDIYLIVGTDAADDVEDALRTLDLTPTQIDWIDHGAERMKALNINFTPAAVVISNGQIHSAAGVPSVKRLHSLLKVAHATEKVA